MTGSIISSGGLAPATGRFVLPIARQALPGVSFVVPVYNKAPHLPRVIAQIKAQQGDFPKQYVFLDDGSSDGSLDIVRAETEGWDNLVIAHQANAGSAAATNAAIALADQPFLKFVDADDLLTDRATLVLLQALADSDACLIYGGVKRFAEAEVPDLQGPADGAAVERLDAPLLPALKNSLFNPTQFLARADAVREVGGCDERVVHSQEYGLTLRLARQWPFLRLDAVVAWLPEHAAGRLSTNEGRQLQRVTKAVANFLTDYPDLSLRVKRYACKRLAGRAWKYARRRGEGGGRWFWRNLAAQLNLPRDHAAFAETCVAAFESAESRPAGEQAPNY